MREMPILNAAGDVVAHALVDDADFAWLSAYRWHLQPARGARTAYVRRTQWNPHEKKHEAVFMHREVLGLPRQFDGRLGDHVDGNGLNCQRYNLRACTYAQNAHNKRRERRNKSGFKGVHRLKTCDRWLASIRINGKSKYLGLYQTAEDAAAAYRTAAVEHFGEFANAG